MRCDVWIEVVRQPDMHTVRGPGMSSVHQENTRNPLHHWLVDRYEELANDARSSVHKFLEKKKGAPGCVART